jgi:hypothetical protein
MVSRLKSMFGDQGVLITEQMFESPKNGDTVALAAP